MFAESGIVKSTDIYRATLQYTLAKQVFFRFFELVFAFILYSM